MNFSIHVILWSYKFINHFTAEHVLFSYSSKYINTQLLLSCYKPVFPCLIFINRIFLFLIRNYRNRMFRFYWLKIFSQPKICHSVHIQHPADKEFIVYGIMMLQQTSPHANTYLPTVLILTELFRFSIFSAHKNGTFQFYGVSLHFSKTNDGCL